MKKPVDINRLIEEKYDPQAYSLRVFRELIDQAIEDHYQKTNGNILQEEKTEEIEEIDLEELKKLVEQKKNNQK